MLITFGVAALINMGTNLLLGKISFISNSVGVILQLALAIATESKTVHIKNAADLIKLSENCSFDH